MRIALFTPSLAGRTAKQLALGPEVFNVAYILGTESNVTNDDSAQGFGVYCRWLFGHYQQRMY